jgi:aspartyl/glutamyl-tRNA(Asn/Gln) amidotransferase C subunit
MNEQEDVERLATLARIRVSKEELPKLAEEFGGILKYISQLDEITLTNTSTAPIAPAHRNVFRADENPTPKGLWTKSLTALFPARNKNLLQVKKIISHD